MLSAHEGVRFGQAHAGRARDLWAVRRLGGDSDAGNGRLMRRERTRAGPGEPIMRHAAPLSRDRCAPLANYATLYSTWNARRLGDGVFSTTTETTSVSGCRSALPPWAGRSTWHIRVRGSSWRRSSWRSLGRKSRGDRSAFMESGDVGDLRRDPWTPSKFELYVERIQMSEPVSEIERLSKVVTSKSL